MIDYTECYDVKTKQNKRKNQAVVTRETEGIFQKVTFEM